MDAMRNLKTEFVKAPGSGFCNQKGSRCFSLVGVLFFQIQLPAAELNKRDSPASAGVLCVRVRARVSERERD